MAASMERVSATWANDDGVLGFMKTGSRAVTEWLTGFTDFGDGRGAATLRTAARDLVLTGLAGLARAALLLALRAAGFAALRGAGALRAAAFTAGLLDLEAFLAGIKLSAAGSIERRIIAPVFPWSSATDCRPAGTVPVHGRFTAGGAVHPLRRYSATIVV